MSDATSHFLREQKAGKWLELPSYTQEIFIEAALDYFLENSQENKAKLEELQKKHDCEIVISARWCWFGGVQHIDDAMLDEPLLPGRMKYFQETFQKYTNRNTLIKNKTKKFEEKFKLKPLQ